MDIKKFIFGDKAGKATADKKTGKSSTVENPYVLGAEGRKEWNDRYFNMAKATRNWQLAFAGAVAVAIVQGFVIGKIASESKIKPYVVETTNGMPYAIKPVEGISEKDKILINYAINQFIINSRTISDDTRAEKALLNKAYAFSADNTLSFLHDYYEKNNPFKIAEKYTVTVNIINALPVSAHTWQITWEETKHALTGGQALEKTRWVAHITYKFGEPQQEYLNDNPFGIFITNVTWSQSQL